MERRISTWTSTSTQPVPNAFVTKGKQRIKQHDGIVYLKDKEEFEIELYNPQSIHQLAKIKLNGKYIKGGGIILKPGQRVFLERFLDSSDKFIFNTYTVGKTDEIKKAIQNNGSVEIEFYKETPPPTITLMPNWQQTPQFIPINTTPWGNSTGNPYPGMGGFTTNYSSSDVTYGTTSMNVSNTMSDTLSKSNLRGMKSSKMETGTIEKGSTSDQKFTYTNMEFETTSWYNVQWKILPLSEQVHTSKTINKIYCTECGGRIRKTSFKFCPQCGTKVE